MADDVAGDARRRERFVEARGERDVGASAHAQPQMIAAARPVDVAQEKPGVDLACSVRFGYSRRDRAVQQTIGAIGRAEQLPGVPVAGGGGQRHARQGGRRRRVVGDDGDDRFDAPSAGVD